MSLEVKTITANDASSLASSWAYVYVEFVRGSNSVVSTRREWPSDEGAVVPFEETLTLVMTLYQNKDGSYQDKKGKLVIKGVSKHTHTTDTLGTAELKLHALVANFDTQRVQFELLDKGRRPMGMVNVAATAKFLGEGKDDDDSSVASSVHSAAQQHSHQGFPDFGMHHRPLQPTPAASSAYSNPDLAARYNSYNRADAPATSATIGVASSGLSGARGTILGGKQKAPDDDSALSSLRAKRGLPAVVPVSTHAPAPVNPAPVAATTTATSVTRSAALAGVPDERDREIQRLRDQLDVTNERQNALEGEFQSKVTAMVGPPFR